MRTKLRAIFSVPADRPELALAQFQAFQKQVPLLYLTLSFNTIALAATHWTVAPWYLGKAIPALLTLISVVRMITWLSSRKREATPRIAIRQLKATMILALVLGAGFTAWALSLYPYGDDLARGHVAFYMAITIVGCIFCLMHLRGAAILLTFVVLGPFTIFFMSTGVEVFQAIALNVVLVAAALIYILNVYYNDFAQLIASRRQIEIRQKETQRLSDENLRLANQDSLTGLPNRRWFLATFAKEFERVRRAEGRLVIGVIDLDGFKPVNDAYGHLAGDKLLVEVGRRLESAAGETLKVARLGGDEFGFFSLLSDDAAAESFGDRLISLLREPYQLPEVSARVGASVGVAVFPGGGENASELFEHADYALYNAKQNKRGTAVLFSTDLATEVAYRSLVEQELRRSDMEREFRMLYQPIWSQEEQRNCAFEALARWNSPALGAVPPDMFILVAERCGLMGRLTEILFRKAIRDAAAWPQDVRLCFNFSAKDIENEATVQTVLNILGDVGFDPSRLVIELTETAVLENIGNAHANLETIRARGIRVALDDFGVGQSSLGQLHRLPVTEIKIDRSFVGDIDTNPVSRNIVRTILGLAGNLGCKCIVEGVETDAQAKVLVALGATMIQGYCYGRPQDQNAVLALLEAEHQNNLSRTAS
jgi:diguanylate cyclase (GGDEF)-like protein